MPTYYTNDLYDQGTSSGTIGNQLNYYWVTSSTSTTTASGQTNYLNTTYHQASAYDSYRHYNAAADLDAKQRRFDEDNEASARRARMLLMAQLTPEQRATFRRKQWFVVKGGKTGRRYRINDKGSICANVDVLADNDNDRVVYKLCAHAQAASVPTCDQLLAQKIMLEWAEADFVAKANRHAA